MREILFRAKRADNGEWVYGCYAKFVPYKGGGVRHWIQPMREDGRMDVIREVLPETIGQYTGLTDKNGKKIFEGDILQAWDFPRDTLTFTVKWYDYGGFNLLGINTKAFNIIGSIHDNPELLEV